MIEIAVLETPLRNGAGLSYFEKDVIISGVGISHVGRRTGIPGLELTLDAARAAIADAGLEPADIDGIATLGDTPRQHVIEALGLTAEDRSSGMDTAGLYSPLTSAFLAVSEGRSRHVLVYRTVAMLGGSLINSTAELPPEPNALTSPPIEPRVPGQRRRVGANGDIGELLAAHAYSASNWVAMHCRKHMDLYGTTKEQLGWMAINSRRNAALNPLAAYRDPITMDDYLAARPISSPLGLYDCDVPVDGSIAVVVSHRDYAADCPSPVAVEAIGGAYGTGGWFHRDDFPKMASVEAAAKMWSRTDLVPKDLDVAELYDGFTFLTIAWLEALGICGEGEGGPFVDGASRIALDGELPMNTYGGQLSAGRMHGYWVLHEACLQLRGQAGERQLRRRPETAVVAAGGGPIAGCLLLTG